MGYKFIITLPGYDVNKATPEQCVVHSDYACPKIDLRKTPKLFGIYEHTFSSNPGVGTTNLFTLNHDLGYKPMHFCNLKDEFYTEPLPYYQGGDQIKAYCDDDNFKIDLTRLSDLVDLTGTTFIFKYYIFVENGA